MESTPGGDTAAPGAPPEAAPQAATPAPAQPPTREYRAMLTFTILVAVAVLAIVAVSSQVSLPSSVLLGPVVEVAAFGVAAYGLSQRRGWARFAMLPLLLIVLVSGFLSSLIALSHSRIDIPIGSILAIWALAARPSTAHGPVPTSSPEGALLAVVAFVSALLPFLG